MPIFAIRRFLATCIALVLVVASALPGLCADLWGYIDRDGKWAISPKFEGAWKFENGIAIVRTLGDTHEEGELKRIDRSGRFLPGSMIEKSIRDILTDYRSSEQQQLRKPGLHSFMTKEDSQFGYADALGNAVIKPQFDFVREFHEGYAAVFQRTVDLGVRGTSPRAGAWHYIDETGKRVLTMPSSVSYAGDFNAGLAFAAMGGSPYPSQAFRPNRGAKWAMIDKQGKIVFHGRFDCDESGNPPEFHEDRAAISHVTGSGIRLFGFVNSKGMLVISPQFINVGEFSEGMAAVCKRKR